MSKKNKAGDNPRLAKIESIDLSDGAEDSTTVTVVNENYVEPSAQETPEESPVSLHYREELLHTAVWAYRQGVLEFLSLGLEGLKVVFDDSKIKENEKSGIFALGAKALFDMMNSAYDKVEDETLTANFANLLDTILGTRQAAVSGAVDGQNPKTPSAG